MRRKSLSWMAVLCFSGGMVLGQSAPPTAAGPPPSKLTLKEGTDVRLKFADDLSSKTANEGDPVNLVLDEDIKVGDVVVAKAGCKATGTITNAKKAGMMGKGGELSCLDGLVRSARTDQARQERRSESGHAVDRLR